MQEMSPAVVGFLLFSSGPTIQEVMGSVQPANGYGGAVRIPVRKLTVPSPGPTGIPINVATANNTGVLPAYTFAASSPESSWSGSGLRSTETGRGSRATCSNQQTGACDMSKRSEVSVV
eukprot:c7789_g1_i2.p1 GENE.c7789_g1_i2~~c7789_g1_i2.p1  ORF type:complete len:119 (+),score=18.08 c7789_g1_i2:168-524(+)